MRRSPVSLLVLLWTAPDAPAVTRAVLENGLQVLVAPVAGATEVALAVAYRAGAAYQEEGQGGVAHLVEHLGFHGNEAIGSLDWSAEKPVLDEIALVAEEIARELDRGEQADFLKLAHDRRRLAGLAGRAQALSLRQGLALGYQECGAGQHTASTGRDFVVFQALLPPGALDCVLVLEARRAEGTLLRGFVEEEQAVLDELRAQWTDPRVQLLERTAETAFAEHPYARSNWGTPQEIARLTPRQAEDFYLRFYQPANAVLVVAGRVDSQAVLSAVAQAFAGLSGGAAAPRLPELPALGPRRIEMPGEEPWVALVWQWPRRSDPDMPALRLLAAVLAERLREALAADPQPPALSIGLQELAAGGAAGSVTMVAVQARDQRALPSIARELERQVAILREVPVTEAEIAAARLPLLRSLDRIFQSPMKLARELAIYEIQTGAAEQLSAQPAALSAVDSGDLLRAAREHLDASRLAIAQLTPGGAPL